MIMLMSVIAAALCACIIGVAMARLLGWPRSVEDMGRWAMALLVSSVLFSMGPAIIRRCADAVGPMPSVPLDELLPTLFVMAVTLVGHVAWKRGQALRERDEPTRLETRQRADAPTLAAVNAPRARFRAAGATEVRGPEGPEA